MNTLVKEAAKEDVLVSVHQSVITLVLDAMDVQELAEQLVDLVALIVQANVEAVVKQLVKIIVQQHVLIAV